RCLFEILMKYPDGLQARDALEQLEQRVTLTDYEAGSYESGGRRFEKIVRFATVDCTKAGWLVKQKGRWLVSDDGRSAYAKYTDPEAVDREAVRLYNVWARNQPDDSEESAASETEKEVSITFEKAEEQAWSEIQAHLRSMNPYEFQELVASLLRAMGYYVSW